MKEEKFHTLQKPPHGRGQRSFRTLKGNSATGAWKANDEFNTEIIVDCKHIPAQDTVCTLAMARGDWVLRLRLQRSDTGRVMGVACHEDT